MCRTTHLETNLSVAAKTSPCWGLALLQLSQYLPARVERFDRPCARAVPKATEPKRLRFPQCCGGAPRAFLHAIQWHFLKVYAVPRYSAALALFFYKDGIKASCQIASKNWTLGTSRLMCMICSNRPNTSPSCTTGVGFGGSSEPRLVA